MVESLSGSLEVTLFYIIHLIMIQPLPLMIALEIDMIELGTIIFEYIQLEKSEMLHSYRI
jgi:hypothetical protein